MPDEQLHPPRLIRLAEVMHKTGLSKTSIYAMIRAGGFPGTVHVGTASFWVESEVDQWISDRIAARDGGQEKKAA